MNAYVFHADAYADLDEAWEFIAAENMDAADRVLQEIDDAISILAAFPEQGHKRPDLTRRPLKPRRSVTVPALQDFAGCAITSLPTRPTKSLCR
jgi:plasmid stabilization system protein ParE